MRVQFKSLHPDAVLPTTATAGDAGLDLRSIDSLVIAPGQRSAVGTGLAVEIPLGYAGLVLPRSGNAARHGIALVNAPGLIDAGYRGELRVLLLNTDREAAFEIAAGDRIAQLVIIEHPLIEPVWSSSLSDSARGEGGFGSTGS